MGVAFAPTHSDSRHDDKDCDWMLGNIPAVLKKPQYNIQKRGHEQTF